MQPLAENSVNTPAFLGKLWKMVNDPSTDHLISWSQSGNSFIIQNQAQFWYDLLPLYYKHNNMSSFVRQLNMYGFHKMSTVENGTMDADRDEIQFTHQYFQKNQPELLKNIKRKVSATPSKTTIENSSKQDELTKVLTDVKQLRGKQASVDNQLLAMKQENALLWREVAILRQKHLKQQKIVNKLIQFLVTLVQPSRMTVGVKRGYQLMLNESPTKKTKLSNSNKNNSNLEGPTIHELDNELDLSPNLYEDDTPLVGDCIKDVPNTINSPATSINSQQTDLNSPLQAVLSEGGEEATWQDKPDYICVNDLDIEESELTGDDNEIITLTVDQPELQSQILEANDIKSEKVFLNPSTQDTFLSNLIKAVPAAAQIIQSFPEKNDKKSEESSLKNSKPATAEPNSMAIAMREKNLCDIIKSMPGTSDCYGADLNTHVESTQNELEQFKDILNGYNSYVDANALLGELNKMPHYKDAYLFNDEISPYDLNLSEKPSNFTESSDPMVSGSELAPYTPSFDFTELFDDSVEADSTAVTTGNNMITNDADASINTPLLVKDEPVFPAIQHKD